jgi:HSP20 family protein
MKISCGIPFAKQLLLTLKMTYTMNAIKRNEANWLPMVFDGMLNTDWLGGTTNERKVSNLPPVNIQENEEMFILALAAPGKSKKDFILELDNDLLSISSEVKKEDGSGENGNNFTRKEFSYDNFKRAFNLPETVDGEKISASYKDGILEIKLPKKEEAKVPPKRMIDIK